MLYPTYLALEALFGRGLAAAMDFGGDWEARTVPVMAITLGYIVMMGTYVARGTFRDLDAIRSVLPGSEAEFAELRQQLTLFERQHLWIWGLVGLVIPCVIGELAVERWTRLLGGQWSVRDACLFAVGSASWILLGRVTACLIDSARLYSQVGERHVEIDLLDLTPLAPLTRHGLRIVLFVVIAAAAAITSAVVGSAPADAVAAPVLVCALVALPLSIASFVLPILGLRRQIRARKAEELSSVREKIHQNRELADGSGAESAEAGAKLPGLLAYMEKIESVREWPFDAPTLTRFFLYVAIPLGSWIGGALVERLLGAALD